MHRTSSTSLIELSQCSYNSSKILVQISYLVWWLRVGFTWLRYLKTAPVLLGADLLRVA